MDSIERLWFSTALLAYAALVLLLFRVPSPSQSNESTSTGFIDMLLFLCTVGSFTAYVASAYQPEIGLLPLLIIVLVACMLVMLFLYCVFSLWAVFIAVCVLAAVTVSGMHMVSPGQGEAAFFVVFLVLLVGLISVVRPYAVFTAYVFGASSFAGQASWEFSHDLSSSWAWLVIFWSGSTLVVLFVNAYRAAIAVINCQAEKENTELKELFEKHKTACAR